MEFNFPTIFWAVYYFGVLVMVLSSLYLSYCSITAKPVFLSFAYQYSIFLAMILWNPVHLRNMWNYYLLTIFLLGFVVTGFIAKKDTYFFANTEKEAQAIAEQALEKLGVSYERLEGSTKIGQHEKASLLYPTSKKASSINFREVKDKSLRKQIIQEIKRTMYDYKKKEKAVGFLLLFIVAIILAVNVFLFR